MVLSFGAKSDQSFATHPETRPTLNRMIAEIPAALIIQAGDNLPSVTADPQQQNSRQIACSSYANCLSVTSISVGLMVQ